MERSDLLRYFVRFLGSLAFLVGVVILNVWVFLGNYRGLVTSFELLGYEPQPLSTDRLIGPFATAFLGRATLADLFALVLAGAISIGFFLCARSMMKLVDFVNERFAGASAADAIQRFNLNRAIMVESFWVAILGVALYYCARTDIRLFHFRSVAQALGLSDPLEAVATVPTMEVLLRERADLFAMQLSYDNAWGYLGMTVICCIAIEYLIQTASRNYQLMMSTRLDDDPGEDIDAAADAGEDRLDVPTAAEGSPAGDTAGQARTRLFRVGRPAPASGEGLFDPASVLPQPEGPQAGAASPAADVRHEVIGRPGERVRMADALGDSGKYYVDSGGQVWDRRLWDDLDRGESGFPKAA